MGPSRLFSRLQSQQLVRSEQLVDLLCLFHFRIESVLQVLKSFLPYIHLMAVGRLLFTYGEDRLAIITGGISGIQIEK